MRRPSPATDSAMDSQPFLAGLRKNLISTRRGITLAWSASPLLSYAILSLTLLSAALAPSMAYVGKLIVDAVVAADYDQTLQYVILEFGLVAGSAMVQRSLFLCRTLLGNRLGIQVNSLILNKAVSLDLAQIENSEYYDKMNRARQEASSRSLSVVTDSFQFVQNAFTLFGYMALLLNFSGWAVLAMVVASIPATWAEMRFSNIGFKLYNWRSPERRKMNYMEYVLANDSHAKELRVFGLAPRFLKTYMDLAERFFREDKALSQRRTLWAILLSLLSSGTFYACYLVVALQAARGQITLGNLTLYVVVFRQGQQAFQSCLAAIGGLYEHNLYLSNLFEFLAMKASSASTEKTLNSPLAKSQFAGLSFENVSFRYPNRDTWALRNFSLQIPQGQSVAIVGSNGAGKSTMIKLLCGLYEPTEGNIYLDQKNLRDWAPEDLMQRVSLVFQDYNRYQLSLQENVGVGQIEHLENVQHIEAAMDRGGAFDLIKDMPKGLQTSLGTWFPGGQELSGGQWQKIAVSRAFMRNKADILILDEPTAALDAEAENLAFQRFQELTSGKTSLIISHRFPVARLAERIIVMEAGTIVEQGSHSDLIALGKRYAKLFQLQAQGYM